MAERAPANAKEYAQVDLMNATTHYQDQIAEHARRAGVTWEKVAEWMDEVSRLERDYLIDACNVDPAIDPET